MIKKCDDCEYSIVIADLMVTLDQMEKYTLKIWTTGKELAFEYTEEHTLTFLQEAIKTERISKYSHTIGYVLYDTIDSILIIDESDER